jgi:benzoate-CoA ligase family protein
VTQMSPRFPDEFNLADYFLFDRLNEGLCDKIAIRFGDMSYSYSDVASRSRSVQTALQLHGVEQEERVYIVLKDIPAFAWSFFGALSHGAVIAMGNPAAPTKDLAYVLQYSRATALITTPDVALSLHDELQSNPHLKILFLVPDAATGQDCETVSESIDNRLLSGSLNVAWLHEALREEHPTSDAQPTTKRDDVAIWLFTSGSTGRPKAAVHTHRDFAFNTEVYAKGTVKYQRDDVTVSVPRLFFGYATGTNLMFPFAVGATAALFSERPTPEALARAINLYQPTVVTNVPTMMGKLLEYDQRDRDAGGTGIDMSMVRFNLSAGEALPPALLERFTKRFECDVYDGIGSAEMFHIYASNRPGDIKPASLGRVVDGYTIRILAQDAEGPGAPQLPPGETGVMWVKGDSVALGYHQDRDKSWSTFHGHWCRTGDLFRIDEEGYLWFSGRADNLLKVSGQWVAPLEVEQCLTSHPDVSLAAIIGAEHDGLTRLKAFIIPREQARGRVSTDSGKAELRDELRAFVKDKLTHHKAPNWVIFADDIPRNDRGKVNKKVLTQREAQGDNPWE